MISKIVKIMLKSRYIVKMYKRIQISSQILLSANDISNEQSDFSLDCKFGTGPAILSHIAGPFYLNDRLILTKLTGLF